MWIGFGSLKGSPGATTLAVLVAGLWPQKRRVLLIEADPDGGSLAARFGLNPDQPGIVTLAAAMRHEIDEAALWGNTQTIPGGLPVLVCSASGSHAQASLLVLAEQVPQIADQIGDTDVLVDLGRLRSVGTESPFLARLDLQIVAVRPNIEELERLVTWLRSAPGGPPIGVVLMGRGPYGSADVAAALVGESDGRAALLGQVNHDARGAAALNLGRGGTKALRRSLLVRSTRPVVEAICA